MTIQEFLKKWYFVEDTYHRVINSIVYRDVQAGLIEENDFRKTTRKINKYRIVAQYFDCALPYTNYYLVFDDKIYKATHHPIWISNILKDMTVDLEKVEE